ncbi:MAG TPA: ankyrin repeat domain-containing protein [Limnochordia bacterium]|nr:ankyrin repeat domain-containing protein [Limnochordia bacterium]
MLIAHDAPVAVAISDAIKKGDLQTIGTLLQENPGLASARLVDPKGSKTLLHVATDWPGHFPNGPAVVKALIRAGADVNAKGTSGRQEPGTPLSTSGHKESETPLHWAASSDDVAVLDVLLDHGADIEADGGVIGNGTPLFDATVFGQWHAARRLVERGAHPTFFDAAALGLQQHVERYVAQADGAGPLTEAFWAACHGGQRATADYLLGRGADINWIADWDGKTPLDAAIGDGFDALVPWLRSHGAKTSDELRAQA